MVEAEIAINRVVEEEIMAVVVIHMEGMIMAEGEVVVVVEVVIMMVDEDIKVEVAITMEEEVEEEEGDTMIEMATAVVAEVGVQAIGTATLGTQEVNGKNTNGGNRTDESMKVGIEDSNILVVEDWMTIINLEVGMNIEGGVVEVAEGMIITKLITILIKFSMKQGKASTVHRHYGWVYRAFVPHIDETVCLNKFLIEKSR